MTKWNSWLHFVAFNRATKENCTVKRLLVLALLVLLLVVSRTMAQEVSEGNPQRLYWFETTTGDVDFASGEEIVFRYEFSNWETRSIAIAWDRVEPGTSLEEAFGGDCTTHLERGTPFNSIAFNTYVGDNNYLSYEDTWVEFHSGSCEGMAYPSGEPIRYWLELAYDNPNVGYRETRMKEIIGMHIWMNDASFVIVEIVHFTRSELDAKYAEDVERFGFPRYRGFDEYFELDVEGEQELFFWTCSSDGKSKKDWFNGRYILLLKPE